MGYYQAGDPGFFDFIGNAVSSMFSSGSRSTGQRYTAEPGQFVSKLGGVLRTVGSIIPGVGAVAGGAGAYMEQAGDAMSYAGAGISEPYGNVGGYRIQPYQNLPSFTVPSYGGQSYGGGRGRYMVGSRPQPPPVYEEYEDYNEEEY